MSNSQIPPIDSNNNKAIHPRIKKHKQSYIHVFRADKPLDTYTCIYCNISMYSELDIKNHYLNIHSINYSDILNIQFRNKTRNTFENANNFNKSSFNKPYISCNNRPSNYSLNTTSSNNLLPNSFNHQDSCNSNFNDYLSFNHDFIENNYNNYINYEEQVNDNIEDDCDIDMSDKFFQTYHQIMYPPKGSTSKFNYIKKDCYPYPDIGTLILHTLLYSERSGMTKVLMKKILLSIKLFLKLYQDTISSKTNEKFKLPSLYSIYDYTIDLKQDLPVLPMKVVKIPKYNKEIPAYINLPSSYLKNLLCNPLYSKSIIAIPDKTPDKMTSLNQCKKWVNSELFKCRCYTFKQFDYWAGEIYNLIMEEVSTGFLVDSFYKYNNDILVNGYYIYQLNTKWPIVSHILIAININTLTNTNINKLNINQYLSYINGQYMKISNIVSNLLLDNIPGKVKIPNYIGGPNKYYPLRIAPLTLFTDDMNGSSHKNNSYETITLQFPGSYYHDGITPNNIFFIAGVQKSKGLKAIDLIPTIVDDLLILEKGIQVYSINEKKIVTVIAPLLWINADNPAHNNICSLKSTNANYPYRKCLIGLFTCHWANSNSTQLQCLDYYLNSNIYRTKHEYSYVAQLFNNNTNPNEISYYSDISYKKSVATELLKLKSFDPSIDTPVEILHTLCLGIIKDVTQYAFDTCKDNGIPLEIIDEAITNLKSINNFTPNLSHSLKYYLKFNGKDYKVLIQILPIIFYHHNILANHPALNSARNLLTLLSKACSLIYTRNIIRNVADYKAYLKYAIKDLIKGLYSYEEQRISLLPTHLKIKVKFMHKLKTHLLVHILEDIDRFGPPIYYSTESSESFNKYVRKVIFSGNNKNSERDLAIKFGREYMHSHILNGGIWFNDSGIQKLSGKVLDFLNHTGKDYINTMMPKHKFNYYIAGENYNTLPKLIEINRNKKSIAIIAIILPNIGNTTNGRLLIALLKNKELRELTIIPNSYTSSNCIQVKLDETNTYNYINTEHISVEHIFHIYIMDNNIYTLNLCKLGSLFYYYLILNH